MPMSSVNSASTATNPTHGPAGTANGRLRGSGFGDETTWPISTVSCAHRGDVD